MNFKEELRVLSENHNSPKLEEVKTILRKAAANGHRTKTLDSRFYDKWVIGWIKKYLN